MTEHEIVKYNRRKKIFLLMFWGGWGIAGIPLLVATMLWGQEANDFVKNIILITSCLGIGTAIVSMCIALNWDFQTLQLSIQKRRNE